MEKNNNMIIVLLKGIGISFILTIVLFYILGMILSSTSDPEKIITPGIIVITGVSILIATSIVMLKSKDKGLIIGGSIGIIYFLLIYMVSSIILNNFELNMYSIIMFLAAFVCGAIGGIVGVNIRNS